MIRRESERSDNIVINIEGTEVAKGAKLRRNRRERRNSKIDKKRSVIG